MARKYLFFQPNNHPLLPVSLINIEADNAAEFNLSKSRNCKLLVSGKPGTGKTTLALRMQKRLLEAKQAPLLEPNFPLYLRARNLTYHDSPSAFFVDAISKCVRTQYSKFGRFAASHWLQHGSFLLIIDDLEFINSETLQKLTLFFESNKRHSFLFVFSNKPNGDFWDRCESVVLSEWKMVEAEKYIRLRLQNQGETTNLISHFEKLRSVDQRFSALEWTQLLDTYSDQRIFELFHLPNLSHTVNYFYWYGHLTIAIKNLGIHPSDDPLKRLGLLALRMLKQARSDFEPSEADFDHDVLAKLVPKVLNREQGRLTFSGQHYQLLLAGKYLGSFWPEAKKELEDESATTLIWTALYNCTRPFIPQHQANDLHKEFSRLATREAESHRQNNIVPNNSTVENEYASSTSIDYYPSYIDNVELAKSSIKAILENCPVDLSLCFDELGSFALKLAQDGRSYFDAGEAKKNLSESVWESVRPNRGASVSGDQLNSRNLFIELGSRISFLHISNQAFLAGRYIARCYPTVSDLAVSINTHAILRKQIIWYASALRAKSKYTSMDESSGEAFGDASMLAAVGLQGHDWTDLHELHFDALAEKESLGEISNAEFEELKQLARLRQDLLNPRTPRELEAEAKRKEAFELVMVALTKYAKTFETQS